MHDARDTFQSNTKLSGILLLVFTDVYFCTDSQIEHQERTLQQAPHQENQESKKTHFLSIFSASTLISSLPSSLVYGVLFPTSLCGVLVLLAAIPPASALPSFPPSSSPPPPLTRSLTHSLTHCTLTLPAVTHSLTHSFTHTTQDLPPRPLLHSLPTYPEPHRRGCGARCRRWCRLLSSSWQAQYPEPPEGAAARVVAAGGAAGCPRGRRSTQSLQKGLRRVLSPLVVPLAVLVAGAVPRASRRGCGARCRRWCRLPSSWQAQYPEPLEGAAARVVAAGAAGCPRGRRSTQSLQKGLRRALSPLVPLAVLVAGAVPRASRRGCGARCHRWCRWLSSRCRRWCRWLSSWQAQYPEPPEGAAIVIARYCHCDLRSKGSHSFGIAL